MGQGFEFGIDPTEDPELAMVSLPQAATLPDPLYTEPCTVFTISVVGRRESNSCQIHKLINHPRQPQRTCG